jgi:type IV pilus assembly protein PilA
MVPMSNSPKSPMSTTNKVLIGVGVGCGCLTVVPILLGIIAAIALPSFLNQSNQAKQSEAKQQVGTIVRGEQAYFLEYDKFTTKVADLKLPIDAENPNYSYTLTVLPGKQQSLVMVQAKSNSPRLKSYTGAARAVALKAGETTTAGIVCGTATASTLAPPFVLPARSSDPLVCPATMVQVQ